MTGQALPTVLFVCVGNAGKSVMAQALMRRSAGARVNALSAGTRAKTGVNPLSAAVINEIGVDITGHQPTQLTDSLIQSADLVVVLGTEARLDPGVTIPVETWETDEPSHRGIDGIERMRLIRDDIANRVQALIAKLVPKDTGPSPEQVAPPTRSPLQAGQPPI